MDEIRIPGIRKARWKKVRSVSAPSKIELKERENYLIHRVTDLSGRVHSQVDVTFVARQKGQKSNRLVFLGKDGDNWDEYTLIESEVVRARDCVLYLSDGAICQVRYAVNLAGGKR